jgi:ATP-binding cassette subfamily F protein uup
LVLDEPTNDLDLQTLRTLEEFLLEYPGCILIVSHDRYFMDRMVDHLFAFEGNGVIRDYPGNYTQYREALLNGLIQDEKAAHQIMVDKSQPKALTKEKVQLSFNEKREFEALENEIAVLGEEKTTLESAMNAGMDYDELQKAAERVQVLVSLLDEKELRWLELSEK